MKKGIIFDLDGTLWEVTDVTYKSVNEIAKKYNIKEVNIKTICDGFGCNKEEVAKLYFPHLDLKVSLRLIDEISIANIVNLKKSGGNIYDALEETLKKLIKEYDLFIVSNADNKEYIETFLITSRLKKYFVDYLAASELNITKAEAINKIIKDNNLLKSIYVGDTKKDLVAAQMSNIPFIQARYGFGRDLKTRYYINSIKELPEIVIKAFKKI